MSKLKAGNIFKVKSEKNIFFVLTEVKGSDVKHKTIFEGELLDKVIECEYYFILMLIDQKLIKKV